MYSGQSGILGAGKSTAAQINLWFAANGPPAAKNHAPDKTYKPAPNNLGEMIIQACNAFSNVVINHDIVSGDIAKECAYWQSAIVREKNNPSGLGATNDNPQGNAKTFSTPYDGILATVAHFLNYFLGEGPWSETDPRVKVMRQLGYMGIAKSLSDLDGKWAWPGNGYGASVAIYANSLLKTPSTGENMIAQIPGFAWEPARSTHYTVGRTTKIVGGAQHYSAGTNSLGWLTKDSGWDDPDNRVSATFLVKHNPTLTDRGWQLVRIEDTAWTTGSWANPRTVSIEYEHKPDVHGAVPDAAYEVLAQTWVDISNYLKANPHLGKIELNRSSIMGHKEWVGSSSLICPDGVDVDRIVKRAQQIANSGGTPPVDEEKFPTGFTLIGAFLNLYRAARKADVHWKLIGVPIGPEIPNVPVAFMQQDGTTKIIPSTVQQTDRGGGWLLWNPETDVATMATQFERKQIEKHLGLAGPDAERIGEYVAELEDLVVRMKKGA